MKRAAVGLTLATMGCAPAFAAWLTSGSRGLIDIPLPLPGLIDGVSGHNLLLLELVIVIVLYATLEAMVRSPWGRVLKAIREDEPAAESLGSATDCRPSSSTRP